MSERVGQKPIIDQVGTVFVKCPVGDHSGSLDQFINHEDPRVRAIGETFLTGIEQKAAEMPDMALEDVVITVVGEANLERNEEGGLARVEPERLSDLLSAVSDKSKKKLGQLGIRLRGR